ncbi:TatD family hydrolase [Metabacillus malikii]|uniref:TatD DNase family protein n=1 Tax=Metabacillus malikii TaxID=1504265 RepID=A0ABT9ZKE0_9BACI|nr:TatD family hydrolase [Metabacillus malikii]MDQ0232251.1 TatD DNase family protein [Metabacillus malikii]
MFDAHIHLDQYEVENLKEQISIWEEKGVKGVLAVASNLKSSYDTLKLKQNYPDFVYAAIGHHPEGDPPNDKDLYELTELISKERNSLSGVGEIGLPTYKKTELYEIHKQERFIDVLEILLATAKQEQLPVSLHAVHEEAETVLASLRKTHTVRAHFHWLKAKPNIVDDIIQNDFYISVTPEVCYRERDQELARRIPIDKLLIETDGPWQFNGPFEDKQTTPLLLKDITSCLANILHIPKKELANQLVLNAKQFWNTMNEYT